MAEDHVSRIVDPYPVIEVLPEWNRKGEEMGSKRKFWYVRPGPEDKTEWLFKTMKTGVYFEYGRVTAGKEGSRRRSIMHHV